jgi:hypothetical protein
MQEDKPPDEEDSGDEEEQCPGGSVFETRSRGMTGTFKWFVVWMSTTITTQPQRLYHPKTRDDEKTTLILFRTLTGDGMVVPWWNSAPLNNPSAWYRPGI